ncbi:MAG: hypothetical protein HUK24_07085 [Sphaerochaetaceae bacterium]|nr:hypothetical protein [Sphaerochaetaceae bacterium]
MDAATGKLLAAHAEKEETTAGYYILFRHAFKRYGVPREIRTDKRRTFWLNNSTQSLMGESLANFDIALSCSSNPDFKPNVERANGTMQKFLPCLLHQRGIKTFDKFQEFVANEFVDLYNKHYKKDFNNEESNFI